MSEQGDNYALSVLPLPKEHGDTKYPRYDVTSRRAYSQDEAVLARFGKKQQLNVSTYNASIFRTQFQISFQNNVIIAEFWTPFYRRIDLHIDDHLGGYFDVRMNQSTRSHQLLASDNNIITRIFQLGLTNGGPSGLVYGFLFAWIGTALQALVMGEMASMLETSRHSFLRRILLTGKLGSLSLVERTIGKLSCVALLPLQNSANMV